MSDESRSATGRSAGQDQPGAPAREDYHVRALGAAFPLIAGLALYGWRAAGVVLLMLLSTMGAVFIWRRIGRRGAALYMPQTLWLALMLALMLPAQLLFYREIGAHHDRLPWTIIPAAALLLTLLNWLGGSAGFLRLHPLLVTYLLLAALFGPLLSQRVVLHRNRVVVGDLGNSVRIDDPQVPREDAWMYWKQHNPPDAVLFDATAPQQLSRYTAAYFHSQPRWFSPDALLRDAMPPLEDLVAGGHPGPIGISSAIAVLIGGLFLLYRGAIDYRVPVLIVLTAYLAFLALPVPVLRTEAGAIWRPICLPRALLDWATVLTFANYQLMASPLLFVAFFLATSSTLSPATGRARATYAVLVGLLAAAAQLYISCPIGPYIGLLVASQLTPWLDDRARSAAEAGKM